MKKILVPCDFSKPAREAFKMAIELATRTRGEIIVMFAIYIPIYDSGFTGEPLGYNPVFLTATEEDAKKEFERWKEDLVPKSLKVSFEIVFGEVVSAIKTLIDSKEIDLVMMGTSGSSGLAEVLIGSTTEKVVRHSSVPVLAIHKAFDLSSIKNIVLPTTLELNQSAFMEKVKALQRFFSATLTILLINTPAYFRRDREAKEALDEFVKHYHVENYVIHFGNYLNEEEGIIDFLKQEKMDLMVMGTHARKGISHLFNGSITENLVNHVQSPVWTYVLKK